MEIGFAGGQITDEELQRRFAAGELQGKTIKLNKKAARKRVASDSEEESGSDSESDASDAPVLTVSAAKRAKGITPEETVCQLATNRSIFISNNTHQAALESKIDEFQVSKGMAWVEKFILQSELPDVDPEDDLKREEAMCVDFMTHQYCAIVQPYDSRYRMTAALDAVNQAKKLLHEHKEPYMRPLDYYAEMLKTDGNAIIYHACCTDVKPRASGQGAQEPDGRELGHRSGGDSQEAA